VAVELRPQETAFDIFVTEQDGTPVWHRLENTSVPDMVHERRVQPREALTFETLWNQRNNAGKPIGPGTYVVRGVLIMDPMNWVAEQMLTISR
jgi:hypothetical protein